MGPASVVLLALTAGIARGQGCDGQDLFATPAPYQCGTTPDSLQVCDADLDVYLDVIVNDRLTGVVRIFLGDGQGGLTPGPEMTMGSSVTSLSCVDLDGDLRPDMVASATVDGEEVVVRAMRLLDGTYSAATVIAHAGLGHVATGDLNGDGRPDIVIASPATGEMRVLLQDAGGAFADTLVTTGLAMNFVSIVDIDDDGQSDLLVSARDLNQVGVLAGHGDGTFAAPAFVDVGDTPTSIAMADLSADGWLDLVVTNRFGHSVSVLLGDGAGGFGPAVELAVGTQPFSADACDLNRDGAVDIVVANRVSNDMSVLLGLGDGTFAPEQRFDAGGAARQVIATDLDRDGAPELVVTNVVEGRVTVLKNRCLPRILTVPQDYATIQEAIDAASDGDVIALNQNVFRGDGNRDLNFRNKHLTLRPADGRDSARIDAQGSESSPHRIADINGQTNSLTFVDLIFEGGFAGTLDQNGAGFRVSHSRSIVFLNCEFRNNETRRGLGGGGMYAFSSFFRVDQCHFHDNITRGSGANLHIRGGATTTIATVIERGTAIKSGSQGHVANGVGIYFAGGTHGLRNSVVRNNPDGFGVSRRGGLGISGAGIAVFGGSLFAMDCEISDNQAVSAFLLGGGAGGGVSVSSSHAILINCVLQQNEAVSDGEYHDDYPFAWSERPRGAVVAAGSGGLAVLINCTVVENTIRPLGPLAPLGLFSAGNNAQVIVRNGIVWQNTGPLLATDGSGAVGFSYTIVEGGADGEGNLDINPLFNAFQLSLRADSPGIDAGDNSAVPGSIVTDFSGGHRFTDLFTAPDTGLGTAPIVDIGAYEFQVLVDCDADLNSDGFLNFFDLQFLLNHYAAGDLEADITGDGVVDFFDIQAYLSLYAAGCV